MYEISFVPEGREAESKKRWSYIDPVGVSPEFLQRLAEIPCLSPDSYAGLLGHPGAPQEEIYLDDTFPVIIARQIVGGESHLRFIAGLESVLIDFAEDQGIDIASPGIVEIPMRRGD